MIIEMFGKLLGFLTGVIRSIDHFFTNFEAGETASVANHGSCYHYPKSTEENWPSLLVLLTETVQHALVLRGGERICLHYGLHVVNRVDEGPETDSSSCSRK